MNPKKYVNKFLDSYALIIALIVEFAITAVCLWIIAPTFIESVAFVLLASIIVLFALRSWLKVHSATRLSDRIMGGILWFSFASVALFFNVSYALNTTELQAEVGGVQITLGDDEVLKRLDARLEKALDTRSEIALQYDQASRSETVDAILYRGRLNDDQILDLEEQIRAREEYIITGKASTQAQQYLTAVTSDRLFNAIPRAVQQERWIELVIYFLIFLGLEFTILIAAVEENQESIKNDSPKKPASNEKIKPNIPVRPTKHVEEENEENEDKEDDEYISGRIESAEPPPIIHVRKRPQPERFKKKEITSKERGSRTLITKIIDTMFELNKDDLLPALHTTVARIKNSPSDILKVVSAEMGVSEKYLTGQYIETIWAALLKVKGPTGLPLIQKNKETLTYEANYSPNLIKETLFSHLKFNYS